MLSCFDLLASFEQSAYNTLFCLSFGMCGIGTVSLVNPSGLQRVTYPKSKAFGRDPEYTVL
jgi:hypothetical protein